MKDSPRSGVLGIEVKLKMRMKDLWNEQNYN